MIVPIVPANTTEPIACSCGGLRAPGGRCIASLEALMTRTPCLVQRQSANCKANPAPDPRMNAMRLRTRGTMRVFPVKRAGAPEHGARLQRALIDTDDRRDFGIVAGGE